VSHFQFHQIKLSKMRSLEVALFGLEDRILVEGRTAVAVKKSALPVDVVVGVPVLRDVVVRVRPDELLTPIPFVAIYEQKLQENQFCFSLYFHLLLRIIPAKITTTQTHDLMVVSPLPYPWLLLFKKCS
jgi:hypothetical protein